jgi:hypothetical protein
MKIIVADSTGPFAENKEQAKKLRRTLIPALGKEEVELDFSGVAFATQSFIHALIAEALRTPDLDAVERITFRNCNESVRAIVEVVVSYSQDDWSSDVTTEDQIGDDASTSAHRAT